VVTLPLSFPVIEKSIRVHTLRFDVFCLNRVEQSTTSGPPRVPSAEALRLLLHEKVISRPPSRNDLTTIFSPLVASAIGATPRYTDTIFYRRCYRRAYSENPLRRLENNFWKEIESIDIGEKKYIEENYDMKINFSEEEGGRSGGDISNDLTAFSKEKSKENRRRPA